MSITADWVEKFVTDAVIEALQNPTLSIRDDGNPDDAAALSALEGDRSLLEELAHAYSDRKITMNEWLVARAPIEDRMNAAQSSIAENSRANLPRRLVRDGTDLRELWPSLTTEKQRAIIESVIDHIVVKRVGLGHYRETSRLVPAWKH